MCTFFQKKSELIIVMQLMPYKIDLYFNGLILFSFSYDENIHFSYNIVNVFSASNLNCYDLCNTQNSRIAISVLLLE